MDALTRTTEHLMNTETAVLITMAIWQDAVDMMMMILGPTRCAAHVIVEVVIFQETNYQLSLKYD